MFQEFQRRPKRFAILLFLTSLLVASTIFGGVVYAFYRHHLDLQAQLPEEPEEEAVEVEFAPPPEPEEPEPEPEPIVEPEPVAVFRPAARRTVIRPPDEIPDETPEESDAELVEAQDDGPTGGDLRGRPGGMGTAVATMEAPPPPPPPPSEMRQRRRPRVSTEDVNRPRIVSGPRSPEVPRAARSQGVQGVVFVRVIIDEEGRLRRFNIVRGPEIFHDAVRAWLRVIRFAPATLADGTATAWTGIIPARFNARNL